MKIKITTLIGISVHFLSSLAVDANPSFALTPVDSIDAVRGEVIVSGKGKLEVGKCSLFLRGECVGEELSTTEVKELFQKSIKKSLMEIGESDPEVINKMTFDFRIAVVMTIRVRIDDVKRGGDYGEEDELVFMYLIQPERVADLEVALPKGSVRFSLVKQIDKDTDLKTKRLFFEKN